MRWFVSQNGSASGPFSEERIVTLLKWGKISQNAYLCDEQFTRWFSIALCPFAAIADRAGDGAVASELDQPSPR